MEKQSFNFLIKNGFIHIFSASVINKIIQFCATMIFIRFLSKEQYGQYSYAENILNIFLLSNGLGVTSAILQYTSENISYKKKIGYLKLSIKYGLSFNIFLAIVVFGFTWLFTVSIEGSGEILRWMFLLPCFTLFFLIVENYLRGCLKNFQYSALSVLNTFFYLVCSVIGLCLYGVWGVIIGRYISYLITDIIAFGMIKKDFFSQKLIPLLEKHEKFEFLRYSVASMFNNSLASILYFIDTSLVGVIIKDSSILASYKVATLIPLALTFIPQAFITFAYPHFAKINSDKLKFKKYYKTFVVYMGFLNFFLTLSLFIFAPFIIQICFGSNYGDSVLPFRILSIGYFFAGTFRMPGGNMICVLKKLKLNTYNVIFSGILNIIFDIAFILWWGAVGAAISTACIYLLSGLIANFCIHYYLNKK